MVALGRVVPTSHEYVSMVEGPKKGPDARRPSGSRLSQVGLARITGKRLQSNFPDCIGKMIFLASHRSHRSPDRAAWACQIITLPTLK